ncbi:hypothetical protein [Paenibacillus sp. Leaf72]|nr:hypothetical protein [Paenibacillus sp. Leaf72]
MRIIKTGPDIVILHRAEVLPCVAPLQKELALIYDTVQLNGAIG